MTLTKPDFGVVGLGRMGGDLALQALEKGFRVVGFDTGTVMPELEQAGLVRAESVAQFKILLKGPRAVFLYIPAGPVVDTVLDKLADQLESGDVLVDGGNSYWGDSVRRHGRMGERGFRFVDLGTSGGIDGARHGACFMAGGDPEAIAIIEPVLQQLAVPGGYVHAGPAGAGHFTKLVHNGIEFGMLQAIGEGVDLLEHYGTPLDIAEVLRCWTNGSVIRSWLVELMEAAYRSNNGMSAIPAFVEDTGEVNWLVGDAMSMEVPIPVIAESVMQLFASRDSDKQWAKAIAMMRHGFGGHPYGSDAGIRRERQHGRVGDIFRGNAPS